MPFGTLVVFQVKYHPALVNAAEPMTDLEYGPPLSKNWTLVVPTQ